MIDLRLAPVVPLKGQDTSHNMKIAFIEPAIGNVEPLGVAYLAQSLINAGHTVQYFEAPRPHFLERVTTFSPDLLAYSVTTGKHRVCQDLNSFLRNRLSSISLFGGPHCTFYPEFIESDPLIDGVCRGEGEEAIVELLDRMESGQDFSRTLNWWLRIDDTIYKNEVRRIVDDLDSVPFPNRDIIYAENKDLHDTPIKRLLGSRGCPFACSYCFNKKYTAMYKGKGKLFRSRTPANIVEEVTELRKAHPFTFIKFTEDIFGIDMDYEDFAQTYGKEVAIPFICNIRPNLIDEKKVKHLKQAGCVAVTIAVESGNEHIRNRILNRNLSADAIDKAITILKQEGIRVWTQNIIANPGESLEMAMETFQLNVRHRVNFAECFLLTPYPGTSIYQYCVENGFFDGDVNKLQKSYWLDSCLRFGSEKEKRQLVNFHKFFSFGVQHPRTLPIINLLIKLPPNRMFVLFNRLYDTWRISRVIRARFTPGNLLRTVRNNISYIKTFFLKDTGDWS